MGRSKRKPGIRGPRKAAGYGWVGLWGDEDLGWVLPDHLSGYTRETDAPRPRNYISDKDRLVLCRITVEAVLDSRGRRITRRAKTTGSSGVKAAGG